MVTKNHAIYQNNEQTSIENKEVEPVEPVQINIYQSNTSREDLRWLHFVDQPRDKKRQQVKDQQSCISVFVAYPTIPSSNQEHQPDMKTVFHSWSYDRFIEIQSSLRGTKLNRTNQGSNFLGGSFSSFSNVRAPILFRRESQPQHLKR